MKKEPVSRRVRTAAGVVLVVCFVVGLILMMAGLMGPGLMFWVISTVGGGGFLYYAKRREEAALADQRGEEGAEEGE